MPSHAADTPSIDDPQLSSIERLQMLIEQAEQLKDAQPGRSREPQAAPVPARTVTSTTALEERALARSRMFDVATPLTRTAASSADESGTETAMETGTETGELLEGTAAEQGAEGGPGSHDRLAIIATRNRLSDVLAGRAHGEHVYAAPTSGASKPVPQASEDESLPIFSALLRPAPATAEESPTASSGSLPTARRSEGARSASPRSHPRSTRQVSRVALLVGGLSLFATLTLGISSRPMPSEDWLLVGLGAFVALLPIAAAPLVRGKTPAARAVLSAVLIAASVLAPLVTWKLQEQAADRSAAAAQTAMAQQERKAEEARRATRVANRQARAVTARFASLSTGAEPATSTLLALGDDTALTIDLLDRLVDEQRAFERSTSDFLDWSKGNGAVRTLDAAQFDRFAATLGEWVDLQRALVDSLLACPAEVPPVNSAASCIGRAETLELHRRWRDAVKVAEQEAADLTSGPA